MNILDRSRVSKALLEMQNHIAAAFKEMVISVFINCNQDIELFARVMTEVLRQHENPTDDYFDEDLIDLFINSEYVKNSNRDDSWYESVYLSVMTLNVFVDKFYDSMDSEYDTLTPGGFDFNTFWHGFQVYADQAIKQFASGRKVDNKIFKQMAIITIINEYKNNGIKLTLRQLYYQMVSKNYIANSEKEYKSIISITGSMREKNILELDEFADNTRFAIRYFYPENLEKFLEEQLNERKYNLDTRKNQPTYIEVWIEKEALRTVVKPITDEYDIPLFICRGYPSTSSLHDQAKTILEKISSDAAIHEVVILYYGDHDPSGKQIPQAIEDIFHNNYQMKHVKVDPRALTLDQVQTYNLPSNPAKMTDPRAAGYVREYGSKSWELDALPPLELQKIIQNDIIEYTESHHLTAIELRQHQDRKKIINIRKNALEHIKAS